MFIITSEKMRQKVLKETGVDETFKALSETNNSVEFHNHLFGTDDCVITEEPNENFIEVKDIEPNQEGL